MNSGTIIRTILAIATCLNTALLATDVAQFGNEKVNEAYKIISVILNFVIVACVTWFNNDYSVEADTHTKLMRQAKELRDFVPETADEPEDSEVDEDGEE